MGAPWMSLRRFNAHHRPVLCKRKNPRGSSPPGSPGERISVGRGCFPSRRSRVLAKQLDHLLIKNGNVGWLSAAHPILIANYFLINQLPFGVTDIILKRVI